jgi:hypothetical protein
MYFTIKTAFKLALRASTTLNEICSSLFVGLALSECLKVILFYMCDMTYMKYAQIPVNKLLQNLLKWTQNTDITTHLHSYRKSPDIQSKPNSNLHGTV